MKIKFVMNKTGQTNCIPALQENSLHKFIYYVYVYVHSSIFKNAKTYWIVRKKMFQFCPRWWEWGPYSQRIRRWTRFFNPLKKQSHELFEFWHFLQSPTAWEVPYDKFIYFYFHKDICICICQTLALPFPFKQQLFTNTSSLLLKKTFDSCLKKFQTYLFLIEPMTMLPLNCNYNIFSKIPITSKSWKTMSKRAYPLSNRDKIFRILQQSWLSSMLSTKSTKIPPFLQIRL